MLPWYSAPTVMYGVFLMVIGHSGIPFTAVFSHHGNVWYILYFIFFGVTPVCVSCCDASTFTEHENHETSNLNMKHVVCVLVYFPFILDVKFVGSTSRSHTGFLIHLPSAVRTFIFLARRIQPFLSLVDREVEFCRALLGNDF